MQVERYGGRGYLANCYLVYDDAETAFAILDPSVPPADVIARRGTLPPISVIILSHAHYDHMICVNEWRALTGAPLAVHQSEKRSLLDADRNAFRMFTGGEGGTDEAEIYLAEGDKLSLGNEALTVWHTPGHTEGSICLHAPGILLSGDTVFLRTIGRTDLPGGSPQDMRKSLCRIFSCKDDMTLYAGHGPLTTLEHEKKFNPFA